MSNKSRNRRTADRSRQWGITGTRVGIAVGGAMAAGFISISTASADDTDNPADPFTDLLGPNATAAELANAAALDSAFNASNSNLAADLDIRIDHGVGLSGDNDPFEDLLPADATPAQVAQATLDDNLLFETNPSFAATLDQQIDMVATLGNGDIDVFEDALPANATAAQIEDATLADNELAGFATQNPTLVAQLDALVDAETPPPDTEPDPFEDALPATATATQIADATAADTALATWNPTLAAELDALVDAGNLPAGSATDADAFSDLGLANGAALDTEFPTIAASLDPFVDQLVPPPLPPPDDDAFTDLAQAFDPNAFSTNAAGVLVPEDFIGTIAADLDTALTPSGFDAALDPLADQIISAFGITTAF